MGIFILFTDDPLDVTINKFTTIHLNQCSTISMQPSFIAANIAKMQKTQNNLPYDNFMYLPQ